MLFHKTDKIALIFFLLSWSNLSAQFGTRPNFSTKRENDAYESKKSAYFENGYFQVQLTQLPLDSIPRSTYVFNGKLTPRLIDQRYFDRLTSPMPVSDGQFFCDEKWQYKWIQVRLLLDLWPGFTDIRTGEITSINLDEYGGYLISAQDSGVFVSSGNSINYIPYSYIKNIRRGKSFGAIASIIFSNALSSWIYEGIDGLLAGIIVMPIAALAYNISGLLPSKVVRMYGEPRGKEFASKVQNQPAYGNSNFPSMEYPLTLIQVNRKNFEVGSRITLTGENFDSLEFIADRIQLEEVPNIQNIQLKINNSLTPSTPITDSVKNALAHDPSIVSNTTMPTKPIQVNAFNNVDGKVPIQWAIDKFEPENVSPRLFKNYPRTQKEILNQSQLDQLTNPADIQMLAIHLLTGNGLDFSRLIQFTEEQTSKLNNTVTVDAVYAEANSTLNTMDIPSVEYRNLILLYERLNQILKK